MMWSNLIEAFSYSSSVITLPSSSHMFLSWSCKTQSPTVKFVVSSTQLWLNKMTFVLHFIRNFIAKMIVTARKIYTDSVFFIRFMVCVWRERHSIQWNSKENCNQMCQSHVIWKMTKDFTNEFLHYFEVLEGFWAANFVEVEEMSEFIF